MQEVTYTFDLPTHCKPIIRVMGVGGGGSNAVNNMYKRGIKDVAFTVCNTDVQALQNSPIQNKLQIGAALTGGLGAGANPEVGRNAALESKESIQELLGNETKMLFITAGMGGGTGTGAAPIIAGIAQKQGILTVGIATLPFSFEGKKKLLQAEEGINELRKYCDTVLIILNDKIQTTLGGLSISQAFLEADNVLTTAAKSIAEIITVPGYVNVDFEDVKTVMKNAGAAVMGSGEAEGKERALQAAETALASPLLDYTDIRGAKKILLSIVSGQSAELQMDELTVITNYIQSQTGDEAEVIFGHGADPEMEEKLRVTVIATGFQQKQAMPTILNASTPDTTLLDRSSSHYPKLPASLFSAKAINSEETMLKASLSAREKEAHEIEAASIQLPLPFHVSQANEEQKGFRLHTATNYIHQKKHLLNWDDRYVREQLALPAYLRKKVQLDIVDKNSPSTEWTTYSLDDSNAT